MSGSSKEWLRLLSVALAALVTIAIADVVLQRFSPIVWLRQVDDGVNDFAHSNPRILSISSSHGRSMDVVAAELARRTAEPGSMVSVAMESGKATHFQFVLDERLRPLIEERRADGSRVHDHLQRAMLVTEWWDSCSWETGKPIVQLPSHAWAMRHFLADAAAHGITPVNRNYLRWRWKRLLHFSLLATDRGRTVVVGDVLATMHGRKPGRSAEDEVAFEQWWRDYNEGGAACVFSADQVFAYKHIIRYLKAQGLDVTVMIFVRKPGTLTQKALGTTIAEYSADMRELAREEGVRLIDVTTRAPLTDADFMADFDHVNANGNRKLAAWLLDGDLSFLACDAHAPCAPAPQARSAAVSSKR